MPEPRVAFVDNEIELAWAAGFFDGEGYVGFPKENTLLRNKKRLYGNFRLAVSQVHREPLDRFLAAVGEGKIYGPYQNRRGKHKDHFVFNAYGNKGVRVFNRLRPYLSAIKLREGDAAAAAFAAQQARPKLGNGQSGKKRGPYKKRETILAAA